MPLLPNNASDVLTNPAMLGTLGRRLLHGNRRDGETEIRRQAVKVGDFIRRFTTNSEVHPKW